ncbi:PREDICTED: proteoglycan 4-like [Priapulus caudatus]|uniref:Proteoglycan 4-like n=1 Tax=Priapulus caudatus TaxID=37621 RepID=A0ABM1DVU6_PRICU|nr:PREDICTED: proteoglycan 4-like [Priapulus caudatus]
MAEWESGSSDTDENAAPKITHAPLDAKEAEKINSTQHIPQKKRTKDRTTLLGVDDPSKQAPGKKVKKKEGKTLAETLAEKRRRSKTPAKLSGSTSVHSGGSANPSRPSTNKSRVRPKSRKQSALSKVTKEPPEKETKKLPDPAKDQEKQPDPNTEKNEPAVPKKNEPESEKPAEPEKEPRKQSEPNKTPEKTANTDQPQDPQEPKTDVSAPPDGKDIKQPVTPAVASVAAAQTVASPNTDDSAPSGGDDEHHDWSVAGDHGGHVDIDSLEREIDKKLEEVRQHANMADYKRLILHPIPEEEQQLNQRALRSIVDGHFMRQLMQGL